MLILAFGSAYKKAVEKGNLTELEMMLNRAIGKVKEVHEVTGDLFEAYLKNLRDQ